MALFPATRYLEETSPSSKPGLTLAVLHRQARRRAAEREGGGGVEAVTGEGGGGSKKQPKRKRHKDLDSTALVSEDPDSSAVVETVPVREQRKKHKRKRRKAAESTDRDSDGCETLRHDPIEGGASEEEDANSTRGGAKAFAAAEILGEIDDEKITAPEKCRKSDNHSFGDSEEEQEDDGCAVSDQEGSVASLLGSEEGGTTAKIERRSPHEGEVKVEAAGFEVLGGRSKASENVKRVHRQLPEWICNADIVESDITQCSRALEEFDLPTAIVRNLQKMGISQLFPVQAHVIPELLPQASGPLLAPLHCGGGRGEGVRDVCVCAPTGCGKTLCYAVPIVAALLDRVVTQVRAVVVVPSQELAVQVSKVFELVSRGTEVKVGVVCGHVAMETEQAMLLDAASFPVCSGVDVVVATPGRLSEHISRPSFASLSFLRFLVIDEADKLLSQQFQDWLPKLLTAINASRSSNNTRSRSHSQELQSSHSHDSRSLRSVLHSLCSEPATLSLLSQQHTACKSSTTSPSPSDCKSATTSPSPSDARRRRVAELFPRTQLQKLLFSATMTHSPELLSLLALRQPRLFTVAGAMETRDEATFTLPQSLEEVMVSCSASRKPLVLLHLLLEREGGRRALCFTNSCQATHRLCVLLTGFGLLTVAELSSSLSPGKRRQILEQFRQGKIQVLVCSDQMSRGMDVEGVGCVVSYEPPRLFRTYLHRAGRTARAGQRGVAYSLLSHSEVHAFGAMLRSVGRGGRRRKERPTELKVTTGDVQPYLAGYQVALDQLRSTVKQQHRRKREGRGEEEEGGRQDIA